jgi:hypothetical protein
VPFQVQKSTSTIAANLREYKQMNGSIDSMEKSQFNSSVDDQSIVDVYEAHNPHNTFNYSEFNKYAKDPKFENEAVNAIVTPPFNLAYRNEGYRDNSTFASREPLPHTSSASFRPDDSESHHQYNASTLPIGSSMATDSTLEMKRDLDETVDDSDMQSEFLGHSTTPTTLPDPRDMYTPSTLGEPMHHDYYGSHTPDPYYYQRDTPSGMMETNIDEEPTRPKSHMVLETDFDDLPPPRSKSEALLETNFDYQHQPSSGYQVPESFLSQAARSKSQPLETAM